MSTICILDPTVRKARTRRRETIREFTRIINQAQQTNPLYATNLRGLVGRLLFIVRSSRMAGWVKEFAFRSIIKRGLAA